MGQQNIRITQSFNAPVETIFNILTDGLQGLAERYERQ